MTEIPFKAEVDIGEGAKSLKALKQEFKDTQKELDGLTAGSQKYVDTLKKLGKVKDQIQDLNQEIKSFNPEGKVQAFSSVVGGLASGFQAATGAAALFGGESKEVEKALLKIQSVMAFTEGIKGVVALGDSFQVLSNIIKANPIGAIATALIALGAELVAVYENMDKTSESTKELTKQAESQKKSVELLTGEIERQVALLTAQGASEEVIIATKKKLIQAQIKEAEINIELHKSKIADIEANNTLTESYYSLMVSIYKFTGQQKQAAIFELAIAQNKKERAKEDLDAIAKSEEDLKNFTNSLLVLDAELVASNKKKNDEILKNQKEHDKKIREELESGEKIREEEIEKAGAEKRKTDKEKELADLKNIQRDANDDLISQQMEAQLTLSLNDWLMTEQREQMKFDIKKRWAEKDKALRVANMEDDLQTSKNLITGLQALSDIYFTWKFARTKKDSEEELQLKKKQFKINKAFQLAQTAIEGVRSIISASTQAPYFYVGLSASIAASVATTAALAKIAATKFEGGGGGYGSIATPSSPPDTSAPPIVNAPSSGTTQLNPDGTVKSLPIEQQQSIVKAIVVETDVTRTQRRVGMIESNAKI